MHSISDRKVYDANGNLITTTVSDENGFFCFLDLEVETYTIQMTDNGQTYSKQATTTKNELSWVDFYL